MKTPRNHDAGSVASHDLFAPFEEWGDHGECYGLVMDGPTILVQADLEEDDEYSHEWHLTYYGGGIWEIEYSKAPELCTVVYRGKLPTREVFLVIMANVEEAPSWANDLLADAMRNYDPEAPENAEIEKMRAQQMRALSQDEIEERQRAQAHLMVNAYSPANDQEEARRK